VNRAALAPAAAFPLAAAEAAGHDVGTCCAAHPSGTCPDHYARSLEPRDETIAELQSVVVAMRHRRDATDRALLEHELCTYLGEALIATDRVALIAHLMALAAVAVRYREEL
jgi:hypothetical protein